MRNGVIVGAVLVLATAAAGLAARSSLVRRQQDQGPGLAGEPSGAHAAASPVTIEVLSAQLAAGRAVIDDIGFTGDTDTLVSASDAAIARLARALATTPGAFLIEAHVPPGGDVLAEQSLTDRRAAAVRARLIAAGVPAARLFAMGFGATRPRASRDARIEVSRMP